MDLLSEFKRTSIPFRSVQYDSWWYGAQKAAKQGCFRWNGNIASAAFPDSLEYVYNASATPITAHNKFWDMSVEYAKQNGGTYDFVVDQFSRKSLPCDETFWTDLFRNGTRWGLKTYEQVLTTSKK